jgi:hypothetical protein
VTVCLVEPGVIATPIWATAATAGEEAMAAVPANAPRYAAQIASAREMAANGTRGADPRLVGRVVLATMTRRNPRPRQTVGRDGALIAFVTRVLPFRAIYRITAGKA